MLRLMRRSAIWWLVGGMWLLIAVLALLRHGWQQAWLQAVIALIFFAIALYTRRKETLR